MSYPKEPLRSFRIAPTPSGYLHEGNAFNFILTAGRAMASGGSLRLRIDDLDAPRVRGAYLQDVFDMLRWLGIQTDKGPRDIAEHQALYSQSLRLKNYQHMLNRLAQAGAVFACTCSRAEIQARHADGYYRGRCLQKELPLDTPDATWRVNTLNGSLVRFQDRLGGTVVMDVAQAAPYFVVRRRDGLPAYHLASLTDDVEFGITDIVRGNDLVASTVAQVYLSRLLGGTDFEAVQFEHHALLLNEEGEKRSKSAGAVSLRAARERGEDRTEVYQRFSQWMSWRAPAFSLAEVADRLKVIEPRQG
jgi:glutamyl-tRNA synthetase